MKSFESFYEEYMRFEPQKEERIAELLWLYYDYHTEKFDRILYFKPSEKYGEAMLIGNFSIRESDRYARKLMHKVNHAAIRLNVTDEMMKRAKMSSFRAVHVNRMFERYQEMIEHEPELFKELKAAGL